MAFSKGKRIEDETSTRIVDLAVNIGCKEGPDALTVTRICKELNCDRRVIYNRFRDIDEINFIVAGKCNEELVEHARSVRLDTASYYENFIAMIEQIFVCVYERNAFFQHYTALYQVTEDGIQNGILQELITLIEQGKTCKDIKSDVNSKEAAEAIWLILIGISGMLATNVNYKYQNAKGTIMYGVKALYHEMQA